MVDRLGSWRNSAAWRAPHLQSMHGRQKMRKIQTLITFFERIFAWGHQNHPDPHCRCHSHPQTPICLCIFPTLLVPRARKVACETADKQTTCSRPRGAACMRKKPSFFLSDGSNCAHHCPRRKACLRKASLLRKRCLDCQR